jgi:hypothetical protein
MCQHYAVDGGGPNALSGAAAMDFAKAASIIDGYQFGLLHPTSVEVGLRLRRGLRQAYILDASGPRHARRGRKVKLVLRLRRAGTGVRSTKTIELRIPADVKPGSHTIKLVGTDADAGSSPDESDLTFVFDAGPSTQKQPQSVADVAREVTALERYDGVTATIGSSDIEAYRDPNLRISGEARVALTVRR